MKKTLHMEFRKRDEIKNRLLSEYDKKTENMGILLKRIKREVNKTRKKLWESYEKKIAHYKGVQSPSKLASHQRENVAGQTPPVPPKQLTRYQNLTVFGTPNALPTPTRPRGPFLCDKKIKLSNNEFQILSKDPKFSVAVEPDHTTFRTEIERTLSKHR